MRQNLQLTARLPQVRINVHEKEIEYKCSLQMSTSMLQRRVL